jgi:hypothetical protein
MRSLDDPTEDHVGQTGDAGYSYQQALHSREGVDIEWRDGEPAKGFKVSFARGVDDLGRQVRWRSLTVPSPGSPLAVEIVTQRLLVEARLP